MISRASQALNLRLALLVAGLVAGRDGKAMATRGARSVDAVEDRCLYLFAAATGWNALVILLIPISGAVLTVMHYSGAGHRHLGVQLFVFMLVAFLAGGLDALWRLVLASAVRKRYRRHNRILSSRDRQLMRASALVLPTLVIQVLLGLGAAVLT